MRATVIACFIINQRIERMNHMSVLKITKDNFESEVLKSEKPVLVDFWAVWCGPCRMVAPTVDEIAEENPQYLVGKVNVDEEPKLAQAFGISSIPTLVAIKDGKIADVIIGVQPKEKILDMLK